MVDALIHAAPNTFIDVCQEYLGRCTVYFHKDAWKTNASGTVLITPLPTPTVFPVWYRFYPRGAGPLDVPEPHVTIYWGPFDFSTKEGTIPTGQVGGEAAFEIVELWLKHVGPNNELLHGWNMLEVGSPEPGHTHSWPQIPTWTQDAGPHNLQIEATVRNMSDQLLTVRFRTQTCPRGQGPYQIPPCGEVVDSEASVTVAPGQTVLLPIWQLRMWSENITEHNWIVDAVTGAIYNALVRYWDNYEYQADDWFLEINSTGGGAGASKWLIGGIVAFALLAVGAEGAIQYRKRKKPRV